MQDFTVHWTSSKPSGQRSIFISMWLRQITANTFKDQIDRTPPYFLYWGWLLGQQEQLEMVVGESGGGLYVKKIYDVSWNVSELRLLPLDLGTDEFENTMLIYFKLVPFDLKSQSPSWSHRRVNFPDVGKLHREPKMTCMTLYVHKLWNTTSEKWVDLDAWNKWSAPLHLITS